MKSKPCPCENCIGKHPECQDNCKSYAIWLDTYDEKDKKRNPLISERVFLYLLILLAVVRL